MSEKKEIAVKDLYTDKELYKTLDEFMALLSKEPPKEWVAHHKYIKVEDEKGNKVPYQYLPIDKIEYLLRKIFKRFKIEITGQGDSFNGVWVSVRVHYYDFINKDWSFHDGIGAMQLQVKSGTSASDLKNINAGALSMAYPHAKTNAIKDACDHFGKLFGSDLNRRDTLSGYTKDDTKKSNEDEVVKNRVLAHIKNSKTLSQLAQVENELEGDEELIEAYINQGKKLGI